MTDRILFGGILFSSGYGIYKLFKESDLTVVNYLNDKFVIVYTNPYSKWTLYIYILCTVISFSVATYNDGKKFLLEHRKNSGSLKDEFKVTLRGCKYNMGENFFDSITFPWHMISNIFPYIVLSMNPRKN